MPVDRNKAEIERILARFGARRRMVFQDDEASYIMLGFEAGTCRIKIRFPLPDRDAFVGVRTNQQEERRRWREIVAYLKSTLIAR